MTHNTNKQLAYNLFRRGAALHPALQLALGVLHSVLRGVRCDDRWTWETRQRKQRNTLKKERFKNSNNKLSDINFNAAYSADPSKHQSK